MPQRNSIGQSALAAAIQFQDSCSPTQYEGNQTDQVTVKNSPLHFGKRRCTYNDFSQLGTIGLMVQS